VYCVWQVVKTPTNISNKSVLILFRHLSSRRCFKGCWVKIIQCLRTNLSLFHKYRYKNWVFYVSQFIMKQHLCYDNISWHCRHITPLHNVLVTDGFLQNFVRASYHYRPHNFFACRLPITKIVTWGPWQPARYQYHLLKYALIIYVNTELSIRYFIL
jgi:hypothetical protein